MRPVNLFNRIKGDVGRHGLSVKDRITDIAKSKGIKVVLARLANVLADRRVTPPMPSGRSPSVVEPETKVREPSRDLSSAWSAFIHYRDDSGAETWRRFTCKSIQGFGRAEHVAGFCHERKAFRMLRIDRIVEMSCLETGELFVASQHFELLRTTGALKTTDKIFTDVGRVLAFLARCDGEYHVKERAAFEGLLERYCVRFDGTGRMMQDALENCHRLAPDASDVVGALRRLSKASDGKRVARFMLDASAEMIDADGRHAPEELEWALEISAALKAVADRD